MDSLININLGSEKLGDVLNNLLEKLEKSVGWIASRETTNKKAVNTFINAVEKMELDPITKSALISNSKSIIKEYRNQTDILKIACQLLQEDAKPEKIDDDWLNQFMSKSKLVSSQEFKLIWGRVLARECNEPGSMPLILLHVLEQMDKEDAESFTALCTISVNMNDEFAPVLPMLKLDECLAMIGINFDKLVNLNALGLINLKTDLLNSYILSSETKSDKVIYFDKEYDLHGEKSISVGCVIYTKSGQALCKAIDVEPVEGFWEKICLPYWK